MVLGAILLLALAARLAVAHILLDGLGRPLEGDEPGYRRLAEGLLSGQGLLDPSGHPTSLRPPLLPILLVPIVALTGGSIAMLRIAMCVASLALVLVCAWLGQETGGRRLGLAMALGAALMPNWVHAASFVLTDTVSAVLLVVMATLLIRTIRTGMRNECLAAGLSLGAAALARPTCLAFAGPVALWLLVTIPRSLPKRRLIALFAVAVVVVVLPWGVRNRIVQGEWVFLSTKGGTELWKSNNPHATGILDTDHRYFNAEGVKLYPIADFPNESVRSGLYAADAKAFIRSHPSDFARLCWVRFVQFWKVFSPRVSARDNVLSIASFGILLPFFLYRVATHSWRAGPDMLFTMLIGTLTAVHCVYTALARYRLPIEPFVMLMALEAAFLPLATLGTWPRAAHGR
jgi:4-amino-4-deoxy-L-arabinose transferase-like glycosyltransferase